MIRFLQRFAAVGLAALILTIGGCDLTSLNDDPNAASNASPGNLLTNAQVDLADVYWDDYPGSFWMRYAQYLTTNQYTDGDRFRFPSARSGSNNDNWADSYFILNDLQQIKRINRESPESVTNFGPNENQIAIATIMQVWVYQVLTDVYGPIPFAEALQGATRTSESFQPAYAGQETIYPALIDSLTAASNMIVPGATTLGGADLVYSGDMQKWKKFANALKMRVAMRMSDRMPDAAAQAINEAIAAGTFESNDDNAAIPFNSSPPYQNPLHENYEVDGRDDWAAPESMLGVMNDLQDPRRATFFTQVEGGGFEGFPYGLEQGAAQALFTSESFSRPGTEVRQATSPCILMLYDEVQFIKAEAALRSDMNVGNVSQSGAQLYEDAVRASLQYWGVTDEAAIDGYLSRIDTPTPGNYEQVLGTQKWIAQYLQGIQGWSTWRRLDFTGVLQVPPGNPGASSFGREIAVRMSYPRDEATLNSEALNAAINNLLGGSGGEDDQGTLLWWDTEYVPPQ